MPWFAGTRVVTVSIGSVTSPPPSTVITAPAWTGLATSVGRPFTST